MAAQHDHETTAGLYRASGIPRLEADVHHLLDPISREEAIEYAEERMFAG
jgi:hypothetical protein